MLKLSFTTMATPDNTGAEAIKMAKKFGFKGVDLRVSPRKGELTVDSTTKEINELKDVFNSEGIEKSGLLCYNDAVTEEAASINGMKQSILKNLDVAERLGSPSIRIFTGNINCLGDTSEHIKRTAEAITSAISEFGGNIEIFVQNHSLYYPVLDSISLVKLVNDPRFKLVFSPDHCAIANQDMNEVYPLVKEVSGKFYVSDGKMVDGKFVDVIPGNGIVPIKESYLALGGKDFTEWVTFKWEKLWQPELEDAETALPAFIEYFNNLYANL